MVSRAYLESSTDLTDEEYALARNLSSHYSSAFKRGLVDKSIRVAIISNKVSKLKNAIDIAQKLEEDFKEEKKIGYIAESVVQSCLFCLMDNHDTNNSRKLIVFNNSPGKPNFFQQRD